MKALIAAGLPVDGPGLENMTPLMLAAEQGFEDETRALINTFRARVDYKDNRGKTPLMFAAQAVEQQSVKVLLEAHADANALDWCGDGAIHHVQEPALLDREQDDYQLQFREERLTIIGHLFRSGANYGIIDVKKIKPVDPSNRLELDGDDIGDPTDFENTRLYIKLSLAMISRSYRPDTDGEVFLDFVLQNATRVNIDEYSWRRALNYLLQVQQRDYLSIHRPFVLGKWERLCRKLADFGIKHGYLIEGNHNGDLARVIKDKVQLNDDPNFIHLFFALGKSGGVRTASGYFTPEAMLAIAMFNTSKEDNKCIWKLLDENYCLVKGRIPSLTNATLLHIACLTRSATDITKLLSYFSSEWDANAVTDTGLTPLMILMGRPEPHPTILEVGQRVSLQSTLISD